MANKASPTGDAVHIPAMDLRHYRITLRGTVISVMRAWSDKAKREMFDKQMGKARGRRSSRTRRLITRPPSTVYPMAARPFPANGV